MRDLSPGDNQTPAELRSRIGELEDDARSDHKHIGELEDQGALDDSLIGGLQRQVRVDRSRIDALEAAARADHALIAQLQAEGESERDKSANLAAALISARRIGAAVGVLMATHKITDEQAFDLLRTASQRTQLKLREVAERVVMTGTVEG